MNTKVKNSKNSCSEKRDDKKGNSKRDEEALPMGHSLKKPLEEERMVINVARAKGVITVVNPR